MKRSTFVAILVILIMLCVVLGIVLWLNVRRNEPPPAGGVQVGTPTPGGFRSLAEIPKPKPVVRAFNGCPPSGDTGDPLLNTLKNRIDENDWQPSSVPEILALRWPDTVEHQPRSRWSRADTEEIARYEGVPVQVEGYLADIKRQGPESCNCHSVTDRDYHIWLVAEPNQGREISVVVETTPRVQTYHPGWTIQELRQIENEKQRVRISGWLMMDPEHPDQVGKTRGTIWEIHPILQIEVKQGNAWKPLDTGTTGVKSEAVGTIRPGIEADTPVALGLTPAVTASPPPPGSTNAQFNGAVQITAVNADGAKRNEPDEYVEIANQGSQPVEITDWTLQDPAGKDTYKWESYTIKPGEVIRVYTNEVHSETGGFSFGSRSPRWNNNGGVAELYDADHELVSRLAYAKK